MDIKEISRLSGIGIVALSKALGLSRGAASQWGTVPAEHVLPLCDLTGWKVSPHQVRPDLYPNPDDALPPGTAVAGDRHAADRRGPDPDFGGFGEPRESARRQDDRRGDGADEQPHEAEAA